VFVCKRVVVHVIVVVVLYNLLEFLFLFLFDLRCDDEYGGGGRSE
jgi:hypothetical protein